MRFSSLNISEGERKLANYVDVSSEILPSIHGMRIFDPNLFTRDDELGVMFKHFFNWKVKGCDKVIPGETPGIVQVGSLASVYAFQTANVVLPDDKYGSSYTNIVVDFQPLEVRTIHGLEEFAKLAVARAAVINLSAPRVQLSV